MPVARTVYRTCYTPCKCNQVLVTPTPSHFFPPRSLTGAFGGALSILEKKYSKYDPFKDMTFIIMLLFSAKKIVYVISPLNRWDFLDQ